jgi:RHS repeat-associated protein
MSLVLTDGTTSYLYDDAGTPIEQVIPAGVALHYGHDQYRSTRPLTDAAGTVAATFTYDPYGNLTAHTGTADTPLRWNGQYQDADTGPYYLRARYYDPQTGQFLTRDPLEALTQAAYGYADGSPLNFADPAGLDPFFGALGAAIGAVAGGVVGAVGYAISAQSQETSLGENSQAQQRAAQSAARSPEAASV